MIRKIILVVFILFLLFFSLNTAKVQFSQNNSQLADEEIVEARIIKVVDEKDKITHDREYLSQTIEAVGTSGSIEDRKITVNSSRTPKFKEGKFKVGDKILLGFIDQGKDSEYFYIISYSRTGPLLLLFLIFLLTAFLVARKNSLYSLLGMGASLILLIQFILPLIISGANPVLASVTGLIIMVPVLFFVSHGINKKTVSAVVGTIISLVITSILAKIFIDAANLTGIASADVETLLYAKRGDIDLKGILLAGTLMGTLGVIDDVAVTQASIVHELKKSNPKILFKDLVIKAMSIGRDHISAVINTLILVYVGGSLSTFLLFSEFPRPFIVLLNSEAVSVQIVVSLIGSIGLILAIPITTIFASWIITKNKKA